MRDRAGIYGVLGHADGSVEHDFGDETVDAGDTTFDAFSPRRLLHPHRAERLVRRRRAPVHLVQHRDDQRPRPRRASTPTPAASPPRSRAATPTRSATTAGRSSRRRSSSTRTSTSTTSRISPPRSSTRTPTRSPAGSAPGVFREWADTGSDGELQPRSVWARVNLWRDLTGEPTTTFSAAGGPVAFEAELDPVLGRVRGRRRRPERRGLVGLRQRRLPGHARRRRRQHRRRDRPEVPMVSRSA